MTYEEAIKMKQLLRTRAWADSITSCDMMNWIMADEVIHQHYQAQIDSLQKELTEHKKASQKIFEQTTETIQSVFNVAKRGAQAMIPLPEDEVRYNGGQRCDAAKGPCSCGAWH